MIKNNSFVDGLVETITRLAHPFEYWVVGQSVTFSQVLFKTTLEKPRV